MSESARRITRSQGITEEDADNRQVLIDKIETNDSTLHADNTHVSCRDLIDRHSRHMSSVKNDNFDIHSMTSSIHKMNLLAQFDLEEESERLALEAKLMRKRADFMERRSLLLKESSNELEVANGTQAKSVHAEVDHNVNRPLQDRPSMEINDDDSRERMKKFLNDCERHSMHKPPTALEQAPVNNVTPDHVQLSNNERNRFDLPKIELPKFSGNTGEYWSFMKQFETHVESRATDPSQRLLYLLNYCCGDAKEAIRGCSILPPNEGYAEARTLLKRLFGRSHVISRELIDDVLRFPRIQRYDDKALTKLYVKMITCWKTLNQMSYLADINAAGTIQRIVDKLPDEMSDRWVRETYLVYESGREPDFMDLVKFVDREAAIAQTRYADRKKMNEKPNDRRIEHKGVDRWSAGPSRSINFVSHETRDKITFSKCALCDGEHKSSQCPSYCKLSVNERWNLAKQKGWCFSCLLSGHTVKECRNRKPCGVNGCIRRHHTSLHIEDKPRSEPDKLICNNLREADAEVSLGIIPIRIIGPKGAEIIHALLDTGANTTLIQRDVVRRLGITGAPTRIKINTVLAESSIIAQKCRFTIESTDATDQVKVKDAFAVEKLPIKLKARSIDHLTKRWAHLDGVQTGEFSDEQIVMIIGCDQPKAHWVLDIRTGNDSQPFAVKTPLGWVILGPMDAKTERMINHVELREEEDKDAIETMITRLYDHEFEDLCSGEKGLSREETMVVELIEKETIQNEGKYEVPLPWRSFPPPLVNNIDYAKKRLSGLRKRFSLNSDLLTRYDRIIQDHLSKGYIAKLRQDEVEEKREAWYIPHHPVFNPKKPEKLRIVFDCAAKYQGRSINDCLYPGPDTTASLVGILLRFRRLPVAIVGDIEEMFLQVRLPKRDQNRMRFLWWDKGKIDEEPGAYKLLVHPFGATSSPFCANYALKRSVMDNKKGMSDVTICIANRCIYVDDCIAAVKDVDTARTVIKELREITGNGGFKLRKWLSNYKEALVNVPTRDLAKNVRLFAKSELPVERTLGVEWDAEHDELRFKCDDPDKANTRRGVLSTIATTFDPLGLVSPLILTAKIILQTLCREKKDWDQQLDGANLSKWTTWKGDMKKLGLIKFPRCIQRGGVYNNQMQLHMFADASEVGYGAVAYVRIPERAGLYDCRLLMSKSRVAPLKTVTIPRLELNAAVLAVRVGKIICTEWEDGFESIHYWTDSEIVLRYLHNTTSRFATFVSNRVQEILELSSISQWRHIQSELNPADHVSRGLPAHKDSLRVWINGPEFLKLPEVEWPTGKAFIAGDSGLELKRGMVLHVTRSDKNSTDKLLEYYSDWFKLRKAVAWLQRFRDYLRIMKGIPVSLKLGALNHEEIDRAENSILRYIQKKRYPKEFEVIVEGNKDGRKVDWNLSELKKLCPRERNGLLVIDSRLRLANVDDAFKYPIVLPKEHPVTSSIIMYYHKKEGHSGTSHILAKIRERFWVIHGGATVKKTLRRCMRCRVLNATSMGQRMAPLPIQRVNASWFPFQHTGVDYFGPFQVKRGRLLERRYGCLFTCLQCRAVHIELAQSLTTDSFVLALIRFINRRGVPNEIRSDNGTNFIGAEKELREWITCWDQNKIVSCLTERKIRWEFNPPSASHRGGIWERMIRTTRKILNSVAWRQSLDEESLWTYLTEAERIINDRPLTAIREGTDELKPIRPRDLLQPRSGESIMVDIPINQLVEKRWRVVNGLVAEFWRRWKSEYLTALQERHKWTRTQRELAKGDIVITEVESTPRTYWPLGVVEDTIADGDGLIRTVIIRTAGGMMKRDIRKVYKLEGEG